MRLLINSAFLRFGGAVQGVLSLVREIRVIRNHEYHLIVGPGLGEQLDRSEFPSNFYFYEQSFGEMKLSMLPTVRRALGMIEAEVSPDCVLTTSGPPYWRSRAPHLVGFNLGLYIYPDSPYFQNVGLYRKLRFLARKQMHKSLLRKEADAIIVQTEDVNERVRRWLGIDRVFTVTNTHSTYYMQPQKFPSRLANGHSRPFRLLTVTNYYPHKNLDIIPEVIKILRERDVGPFEFVMTLTPEEYTKNIGYPIPREVKLTGPVPAIQCPSLYAECDAMFLPTLAECFSASYAEAMAMRKPVLTTNLGFAKSICGPAALYFEPGDPLSASERILKLMSDEDIQKRLVEAGTYQLSNFETPSSRAAKIIDICEELASSHTHSTT